MIAFISTEWSHGTMIFSSLWPYLDVLPKSMIPSRDYSSEHHKRYFTAVISIFLFTLLFVLWAYLNVLLFNFKTAYHVTVSRCSDIKPVRVTLEGLGSYGPVKRCLLHFHHLQTEACTIRYQQWTLEPWWI